MNQPDESTALIEYYGRRILLALETLVHAERQGLRVKMAKAQESKINQVQYEEGVQAIVRRLDQAPEGMTTREIADWLIKAGHERIAKNVVAQAKNHRKNPLDELVKAQLIFFSRDPTTRAPKFARRRYFTRGWYLRKFAQLPDYAQRTEMEDALTAVDNSLSGD
jgi:hypothetical protein